jgi:hypothetical protein
MRGAIARGTSVGNPRTPPARLVDADVVALDRSCELPSWSVGNTCESRHRRGGDAIVDCSTKSLARALHNRRRMRDNIAEQVLDATTDLRDARHLVDVEGMSSPKDQRS